MPAIPCEQGSLIAALEFHGRPGLIAHKRWLARNVRRAERVRRKESKQIHEQQFLMLLFVIDGRQPNYSAGATLTELAEVILEHGGHHALNLDGGGSSTLVIEGPDGQPEVLNSPIHRRIPPSRERPVANHLGVHAEPI